MFCFIQWLSDWWRLCDRCAVTSWLDGAIVPTVAMCIQLRPRLLRLGSVVMGARTSVKTSSMADATGRCAVTTTRQWHSSHNPHKLHQQWWVLPLSPLYVLRSHVVTNKNQHPVFYRPDTLLVTQPTVSKHWRELVVTSAKEVVFTCLSVCLSVC